MLPILETIIAAIVWAIANVVYIDMRRKGVEGFTRFAAFWVGNPTTWIWLFSIDEGTVPTFDPVDDETLLDQIRRDRIERRSSADEDVEPTL